MVNFTEYQMINNISNLQNHANNEIVARLYIDRLSHKIKLHQDLHNNIFQKITSKKITKKAVHSF